MTYDEQSFPQDQATGLQDTIDWNDAAGFAWLTHHPNTTACVIGEDSFEMAVNWTDNILNIGAGVAALYQPEARTNDHRDDGGDGEMDLVHTTFRVQRGPSGSINLNDGTNYVFLSLDQTANNTVEWYTNTTGNAPPEPYLLVAVINTDFEDIDRPNDHPETTHNRVLIT